MDPQKERRYLVGTGYAIVEGEKAGKQGGQRENFQLVDSLYSPLWSVELQYLFSQTVALNPHWAPGPPVQLTKYRYLSPTFRDSDLAVLPYLNFRS